MPRKSIKPKVSRISDWGYEVIYKCGKCGYVFAMAHDGYDYCPHCGSKIDWGVISEVNEEWRSKYIGADYNRRQELNAEIDIVNESIMDGEKKCMTFTPSTKTSNYNKKYWILSRTRLGERRTHKKRHLHRKRF